jgi:pantetheine-phosphate adenylyltransferase
MRRYPVAVLGGTFDHLHVGHHALLSTAFRVGDGVGIGLTTDRFVASRPKPLPTRIQPFSVRRAALVRWVRRNYLGRRWWLVAIEGPFGRSIEPGVDALVVSPETLAGGRAVNRERRRLGRRPVALVRVPLALADDLEPVSSRRIRAGTIRPDGRRLSPIRILVTTSDPRERAIVERAVRRVFPRARIAAPTAHRSKPRTVAPRPAGTRASPLAPPWDLSVRVSRRNTGGWVASERSPRVRLRARVVPGSRPTDLEWGLVALLRPRQ